MTKYENRLEVKKSRQRDNDVHAAAVFLSGEGWKQDDNGLWHHPAIKDCPFFGGPLEAMKWNKGRS